MFGEEGTYYNLHEAVSAYEAGEMEPEDVTEFFQYLVDSGNILALQGSYQRTAQRLIDNGEISPPDWA